MALNISSDLVPQVINDYNAYTEDDLLIGLADEVTLPKIKNKTTTVSGMGIAGDVDSPVPGQFESMEATLNWNTMYSFATKMMNPNKNIQITLRAAIPYIASAQNTSTSTGGTDTEGDDSFTRRIHYAPSIFSIAGPADAYEYFAESWRTDVSGTKIICEEGYAIHIYFLMDGGRLPTEEECRGMEDYFTTVKKPMGDLVLCHAPQEVPYDINLTYYIASSNTKSAVTIQENVEKAVQAYETWQRKIGRDIDPAELIMRVREAGAKRPKLTGPVDTKVTETQVAKLNSKKITYGGIEDD